MQRPPWLFDELAHAGAEHLDPEYVAAYDKKSGTDPAPDVGLLRELGLDHRSTVVDVGAGTGTFAVAVAPMCARVVATDVSPSMLAVVREKAERLGYGNIETVLAGFLTYEHRGSPADVVYSRNALHHLPDFWKAVALKRLAEMLRPGGLFLFRDLVYSFDLRDVEASLTWFTKASGDSRRGWSRGEREVHVRDEHSSFDWLLEPMLERAGFTIERVQHRENVLAMYLCRRR